MSDIVEYGINIGYTWFLFLFDWICVYYCLLFIYIYLITNAKHAEDNTRKTFNRCPLADQQEHCLYTCSM